MRITLLTFGSRGDVQPFVALGAGLRRAGYDVRLAAPDRFAELATTYGLTFFPLAGDLDTLSRNFVERAGMNPVRAIQVMAEQVAPVAVEVHRQVVRACDGTDAIVHSMVMTMSGHQMAHVHDIPDFSAQVMPLFAPTRAFSGLMFPALPLGGLYNWLTHQAFIQGFRQSARFLYRGARKRIPDLADLPPWPFAAANPKRPPLLFAFSRHVIPPPADWRAGVHVTGYWFLDRPPDWQPPPGLADFLAAGPPPVCVSFGSMRHDDPERTTGIVLDALARAGQRGVLVTGWGGLSQAAVPEGVFVAPSVPFDWLLPRMAAVVHHGGAGSTGAGLRAGAPSIIVPFFGDQPFWGERVKALGVGPAPIPRKALTVEELAYAIRVAATHEPMRARAAALGEKIRAEDGVGRAVSVIALHLRAPAGLHPRA